MAERKKFENIKREEFETTINTIKKQIEKLKKELKENNEKMNDWNRNIQENLKNNNDKLDIILQALKSNKSENQIKPKKISVSEQHSNRKSTNKKKKNNNKKNKSKNEGKTNSYNETIEKLRYIENEETYDNKKYRIIQIN